MNSAWSGRKWRRRCISLTGGEFVQDSAYRWWPKTRGCRKIPCPAAASFLGRLCRYYLECLARESGSGISIPAAAQDTDYAGLDALPFAQQGLTAPGSDRRHQEDPAQGAAGAGAARALHRLCGSPAAGAHRGSGGDADRAGAALPDRRDAGRPGRHCCGRPAASRSSISRC